MAGQDRAMETLREAIERLEEAGFHRAFRARRGGLLEIDDASFAPETLVVEEVVRFEGESDPADEAVLFALRSQDGNVRGTFTAGYGTSLEPAVVAAVRRLREDRAKRGAGRSPRKGA